MKKMEQEIYDRLSILEQNTNQILFILESNKKTNQKGLVETVQEEKEKLNALLTREKVFIAKASTYGVIGGILATFTMWTIQFFVLKNK